MASKDSGTKASGTGTRAKTASRAKAAPPVADRVVDAAMRLIPERGWRALTLPEIAEEAGVTLADMRRAVAGKDAILDHFRARIDAQVLEAAEDADLAGESARNRLFDVTMSRFEALEPYRPAIARLREEWGRDPLAALCAARGAVASMRWMLAAAGIEAGGLKGAALARGLLLIQARVLPVWLSETEEGMPRTLSALDTELARAERFMRGVERACCGAAWRSRDEAAPDMQEAGA